MEEIVQWIDFKQYMSEINPDFKKEGGVYRLTFENGKSYIGQTANLYDRIDNHLFYFRGLELGRLKSCPAQWYYDAIKDNGLRTKSIWEMMQAIKIEVFPCENHVELEKELLSVERTQCNQGRYYNSEFYRPRPWSTSKERRGNFSAVIF